MALLDAEQRVGGRDGQAVVLANRRAETSSRLRNRSRSMWRTITTCWAWRWPMYSRAGPTRWMSFSITVEAVEVPGRRALELRESLRPRRSVVRRVGSDRGGSRCPSTRRACSGIAALALAGRPRRVEGAHGFTRLEAGRAGPRLRRGRRAKLAVVEHPHRRHEADAVADPALEDRVAQLVRLMDDDHERGRRREASPSAALAARGIGPR